MTVLEDFLLSLETNLNYTTTSLLRYIFSPHCSFKKLSFSGKLQREIKKKKKKIYIKQ